MFKKIIPALLLTTACQAQTPNPTGVQAPNMAPETKNTETTQSNFPKQDIEDLIKNARGKIVTITQNDDGSVDYTISDNETQPAPTPPRSVEVTIIQPDRQTPEQTTNDIPNVPAPIATQPPIQNIPEVPAHDTPTTPVENAEDTEYKNSPTVARPGDLVPKFVALTKEILNEAGYGNNTSIKEISFFDLDTRTSGSLQLLENFLRENNQALTQYPERPLTILTQVTLTSGEKMKKWFQFGISQKGSTDSKEANIFFVPMPPKEKNPSSTPKSQIVFAHDNGDSQNFPFSEKLSQEANIIRSAVLNSLRGKIGPYQLVDYTFSFDGNEEFHTYKDIETAIFNRHSHGEQPVRLLVSATNYTTGEVYPRVLDIHVEKDENNNSSLGRIQIEYSRMPLPDNGMFNYDLLTRQEQLLVEEIFTPHIQRINEHPDAQLTFLTPSLAGGDAVSVLEAPQVGDYTRDYLSRKPGEQLKLTAVLTFPSLGETYNHEVSIQFTNPEASSDWNFQVH